MEVVVPVGIVLQLYESGPVLVHSSVCVCVCVCVCKVKIRLLYHCSLYWVWRWLTLGAHAQRGLQSVCYHVFCHRAQQCAQEDIPRDMSKVLKLAFSLKMLGSEVMASFAYRGSCCSDP